MTHAYLFEKVTRFTIPWDAKGHQQQQQEQQGQQDQQQAHLMSNESAMAAVMMDA
jgi:hypothetical protein